MLQGNNQLVSIRNKHIIDCNFSSSNNERLQEVSIPHEPVPWSQQHPNEVNAFAEMFRQNYNRMVAQHNEMMQMHQQTMANMFIPGRYK